jgi:hypothetical protein
MANYEAQIKPGGLSQRNLVDLLYMIVAAIKGICAKLDDDGGVTATTYESSAFTAIFNGYIEDSRGNSIMNRANDGSGTYVTDERFFIITPMGISDHDLNECLYQIFDMFETLTEALDTDALTDSTYEALCYTALWTWKIENRKGSTLGNGNTYFFRPGGMHNQDQLIDLLYQIVNAIETLTEQLDADGTVTDTNYEALWFTAKVTMHVQNSQGNVVGNTITVQP